MHRIWQVILIMATLVNSIIVAQETTEKNTSAIYALTERLFPKQSKNFKFGFLRDGENEFEIKTNGEQIEISGSDKSALNAGFGYYLRHVAKMQITDCGSNLFVPKKWPLPAGKIKQKSLSQIRNSYNYCTHCYTMASWNWEQWELELDRIALMGINQALVLQGHEKVWQNFLKNFGCSDADILTFLPSCTFTAWWLMANLEGHGGQISQNIIEKEAEMGRKMCDRMRELGIEPIVNGFFGMVPTFLPKYIKGNYISQGHWVTGFVRPTVLSPLDNEFPRLAKTWYSEIEKVFGKVKYYGGDLFHEGGNSGGLNLTDCGVAIQNAMLASNPNGIYVLQGWHNNPNENLLKGMNKKHAMVQQLTKDISTLKPGGRYRTYSGLPWTLNEIGNFGGNTGMYGNLESIATLPERLFNKSENGDVVGLGLLAEGFNNNPVMYELWADIFFSDKNLNLQSWLKDYLLQRYGTCTEKQLKAWDLLAKSVYAVPSDQEGVCDFVISAQPGLNVTKSRFWCGNNYYWNLLDVYNAAELLLAEPQMKKEGWRFDTVDVLRQLLNGYSLDALQKVKRAYESKNLVEFNKAAKQFLEIFDELDDILATNEFRLLGKEIEQIRAKGKTTEDKALLEKSLRMLWTTWADKVDPGLNDYASRTFAGLVKDYYKKRWEIYINDLRLSLQGNGDGRYSGIDFEKSWRNETKKFASKPKGNLLKLGNKIVKKYGAEIKKNAERRKNAEKFKWKLNPQGSDVQTLEFDVTNEIRTAGIYDVTIDYREGANALKIQKTQLFEGNKLVVEDIHEGYSGIRKEKNLYTLNLKKFRDDLTNYTLKITVSGDNGKNSSGIMVFEKR